MPTTPTGIAAAFAMLTDAGCRPTQGMAMNIERAMLTWRDTTYDISDQELLAAVTAYLRTPEAKWWPSIGTLLELTPRGHAMACLAQAGDEQWGEAMTRLRRHSSANAPVSPDDPRWAEVRTTFRGAPTAMPWRWSDDPNECRAIQSGLAAMGGWRAFQVLQEDQLAPARAAFRSAYSAVVKRGPVDEVIKRLEQRSGPMFLIEGGKKAGA